MPSLTHLSVLIIIVCHVQTYIEHAYANAFYSLEMTDFVNGGRRGRGLINQKQLVKMGFSVVNTLLDGAEEVMSKDVFKKSYVKHGGIKQMVRDFNNFYFQDVKKVTTKDGATGRVGRIADRVVISKSKGYDGLPTIEILHIKDPVGRMRTGRQFEAVRDEITYID